MAMTRLISVDDLTDRQIDMVMRVASQMRNRALGRHCSISGAFMFLRGDKTVANLFYEPSTRTAASFHIAATNLGAAVYSVDDVQFSSLAKGESLADTLRVIGQYVDAIVIRHPSHKAVVEAAEASPVPVINAGSGGVEHPTQALLDLYTIEQYHGVRDGRENVDIGVMGDLRHGRAAQSLIRLLGRYDTTRLHFISPKVLRLPKGFGVGGCTWEKLDGPTHCPIEHLDVLYLTRLQWERMTEQEQRDCGIGGPPYGLTVEDMKRAKNDMIVMHPLPRLGELPREIDDDPRAVYFEQARNGLYVRMALLWCMMRRML